MNRLRRMMAAMGGGAGAAPWYQADDAPTPLVVYQPGGNSSLASSYSNLANPGTNDAALGVAPTWDRVNGWMFDGATQWLNTAIVPASGYTMMIKYSGVSYTGGGGWACGVDSSGTDDSRLYLNPAFNFTSPVLYGSGELLSVGATHKSGNLCVAGQQGYRDGVADGGAIGAWVAAQTRAIIIGGLRNTSNNPSNFGQLFVQAFSIWSTTLTGDQVLAVKNALDLELPSVTSTTVNDTTGGENIRVLVPSNYSAVDGAPLVIYHHGADENETSINHATKAAIVTGLLNAGYIVAASNAAGNNWGNAAGVAAYEALYTYCNTNYNITRVVALSQSMGGLTGLTTLADGVIPYKGWLGVFPACSLSDIYNGGAGFYAGEIETAYGFADPGDYAAATSGYDPLLRAATLYDNKRLRFYASAADTVVDKVANSDAMKTHTDTHATENVVSVCAGNHGHASHFQAPTVVQFFDRCV